MGDGLQTGDPLQPVPLQELQLLEQGKHWSIAQRLSELDSLTPVRGHLHAVHRGNVLELDGEANTIVTLCCDRCLQQFNHPLSFQTREVLWLGEQAREQGMDLESVLEAGGDVPELFQVELVAGAVEQRAECATRARRVVGEQPLGQVGEALVEDRILGIGRQPDALERREGARAKAAV